MKSIASRQNVWFKRIREAIRDHADELVIEGPKPVADAIANGWSPITVVVRQSTESAPSLDVPALSFSGELFDALSETKASQGVLALFARPHTHPETLFADPGRVVVALDRVQDPGNVGTIVRLAAAFDAAGVVLLPGCADAFGPKAIRSSVGAILNVPVVSMSVEELIAIGWPLFAADAAGETDDPPPRHAVLVFGSEGLGISDEVRAAATSLAIATSGRVESLNVAASAAILLSRSFALRGIRSASG